MKFLSVLALAGVLFFQTNAANAQWALGLGANQTEWDATGLDSNLGFQGGVYYYMPVGGMTNVKIGGFLTQRGLDVGGTTFSNLYLSVPVHFQFMFSSMFGVFGGLNLNILAQEDDNLANSESLPIGIPIGVEFRFTEMIGLEAFYELGATEIAPNVDYSAFGANLLIHF